LQAYHEHPGTFARLAPPWQRMRIIERSGGLGPGARTVFKGWIGPVPFVWEAVHVEHQGAGFTDVMRKGPFKSWRHEHVFEQLGNGSKLTDIITATAPGEPFSNPKVQREITALLRYRHAVTQDDLSDDNPQPLRIAVTGASGLIGSRLVSRLEIRGHRVISLVRGTPGAGQVRWNPQGDWDASALDGIDAVVHLAGESIGSHLRWNPEVKRKILDSRAQGTHFLSTALARLQNPPKVLVSASAVGFYGDRGNELLSEDAPPGEGFLAEVCEQWEAAADPARETGIRVVHPRIGYVVAAKNAAIKPLVWLTLLGAGGPLAGGKHYVGWISLHDVTRALEHMIHTPMMGPVNVTGPDPVPQKQFARTLGRVLKRPALLPAPGFAIRGILGELGDEILKSQRAHPTALLASDFRFRHPSLTEALRDELGR
jgi:uncharacterized protein